MSNESLRPQPSYFNCLRRRVNSAGAGLVLALLLGGLSSGWILRGFRDNGWRIGPEPARWHPATLVGVVDGDTIKVKWNGKVTEVRMLNINTPERGQPGYLEGTEHLKAMLGDATAVMLEFETDGVYTRDGAGRLLCYVWLNGENLNVEQVRAGHSRFYTKGGTGRYPAEFQDAISESR